MNKSNEYNEQEEANCLFLVGIIIIIKFLFFFLRKI